MNKVFRWIRNGVGILAALLVILALLIYFPPVQRWLVEKATAYASEQTGMDISIRQVSLSFPLDLSVDGVKVLKPNDSIKTRTDTIIDARHIIVNVKLWPLLHSQVDIASLDFRGMKVNTDGLIPAARISGSVGHLFLDQQGIVNWKHEIVRVPSLKLYDARLDLALSDTVPPDTAPSKNFWKIHAQRLDIRRTHFTLHMPGDTMSVAALLDDARAEKVYLDLYKGLYQVQHLDWQKGGVSYDQNFVARAKSGFDPSHLALSGLTLKADSFYYCDNLLKINIRQARFLEKSGLQVTRLEGPFSMDSTSLHLRQMVLTTPTTTLGADVDMDLNAFDDRHPGALNVTLRGQIGRADLMVFLAGAAPQALVRNWPRQPLYVDATLRGNLKRARLRTVRVRIPHTFDVKASGWVAGVMNPDKMKAELKVNAKTYDLGFITAMLDKEMRRTIAIPQDIGFDGSVRIDGQKYASDFRATQGRGSLTGRASIDVSRMAYDAKLLATRFPVQHFVKGMDLHPFSGLVEARGKGTDIFSPRTRLQAKAQVTQFQYGAYNLDRLTAAANIADGRISAHVKSDNKLFKGIVDFNALAQRHGIRATVSADVNHVDLYNLRLVDAPLVVGMCAHVDINSDLKHSHAIMGDVGDITLADAHRTYRPDDVRMDVISRRDTTHAIVSSGDLYLNMNAQGGYEQLLSSFDRVMAEARQQMTKKTIDQARLRERLPEMRITFRSGHDNMLFQFLQRYRYTVKNFSMDLSSSPVYGLNGTMEIDSLVADSMLLDTIRMKLASDSTTTRYYAQVRNNKMNPQHTFNVLFEGALQPHGTFLKTQVFDKNDRLGIRVNLSADMWPRGISIHLFDDNPILGYKEFEVNDSNYIYMRNDRRVSANMKLRSSDGMALQLLSNDADTTALQNLTLSLHQFSIGEVLSLLPYAPRLTGVLDGDFHVIKTPEDLSVASSINVSDMTYEGWKMGDVAADFTYMPFNNGRHYLYGTLANNDREVAQFSGTYSDEDGGNLDASLDLNETPLQLVNGFIPGRIIGFRGQGDGTLSVKGSLSQPVVNGELYLDSAYVFSAPYGVEMRFANDPVTISNSKLLFENFEMFAHNDQSLDISGSCDFSDLDHITLDTRMQAENFLLIDSKENVRSEAYGKAYVNVFGMMRGELDNLQMRGRVDVLGSTSLKYNLKDSPLSTDNQLDELVQFTDFRDSATTAVTRPPLTGFDVDMSVNIDEGASIECFLNTDHTNYLNVVGGGTMRLQYNATDNLTLRGRYTIDNGEMKYSLPVIPLKTFTIENGSYIEFKGDPMNPTLNITANEKTKSTVGKGANQRSVEFLCGVVVTQTLDDMGLEFTIDAPEDLTLHNQLMAMSKEARGKLAVTMLTTGMWLADGSMSSFSMNSALSAFLNSQINSISNSALRSLDLSFGMENTRTATGMQTDYNFKFAKRFWNNRLRIVVGGKFSSGENVTIQDQTFFDNVNFEYRLSDTSSKYLNLFYERNAYDWLEGNITKYGVGFTWKKSVRRLKDIFRWGKDPEDQLPVVKPDTTATKGGEDKKE